MNPMHLAPIPAVLMLAATQLTHLAPIDIAILLLYFAMVIFIGFYVKGSTNTSEQFFLAGREMTAWIAGLSFVSANLGSLELMGWAGAAYQYGILATHWYWIGAIPAMLFLGIVMMPFYYISKTHSVPGYLQLRFGEGARGLSGVCFAFMTILMSGVNMYAMAVVMQVVLGWNIYFSMWVGAITVAHLRHARRPALGHHQRGAAVRPHLGGRHADPHPRPDRSRRLAQSQGADHRNAWAPSTPTSGPPPAASAPTPWASIGPASSSASASSSRSATGPPTSWSSSACSPPTACAPRGWRRSSARHSRCSCPSLSSCPACSPWCCSRIPPATSSSSTPPDSDMVLHHGAHSFNEVLPLMMVRYLGPGLLGLGITALIAGFMSGMAGNVSAFSTVWTYDIYGAYINKKASDSHYVLMGRWSTILGMAVSVGTAYLVMHVGQHHGLRAGSSSASSSRRSSAPSSWACCGSAPPRPAASGACSAGTAASIAMWWPAARQGQHPLHDPEPHALAPYTIRARAGDGREPLPRGCGRGSSASPSPSSSAT